MLNNQIVMNDMENIFNYGSDFSKLKNKSILITGATGMLASYYLGFLLYLNKYHNYNIKIYALARNEEKLDKVVDDYKENVNYIVQDVTKPIKIDDNIDYIIHMASSANPKTLVNNPVSIIDANVIGTKNVLELAKDKNAEVLFTSTREIYGKIENRDEIKENDMGILDNSIVRSCYPESKRLAENMIVSYGYQYNVNYKIARIAHSYGPGMIIHDDGRIMSDLLSNIINNENIVLKSSGDALRAFCYVSDATLALLLITVSDKNNEIYNVSNETEEISIRNLAEKLIEMYPDKNLKVVYDIDKDSGTKYVNFKRTKLNDEKLYSLGFTPQVNLENGIRNTISYEESKKVYTKK